MRLILLLHFILSQGSNPTSAGNHAFLDEPAIAVSTQKMTVNWASAFSGTVTVGVRTTGCGAPSDYYNVIIDVVPDIKHYRKWGYSS